MVTQFHKYTVAAADPKKLQLAHDIGDLKDERLLTSSEALGHFRRVQHAEVIREAVHNYYSVNGIRGGWVPELATVVHLESLVNKLAPVVALIETERQYPSFSKFHCKLKTKSSDEGLQITVSVREEPAATVINGVAPETDPIQEGSYSFPQYEEDVEQRRKWWISLSTTLKPADTIALCSKAISRYQFMERRNLESLAKPFQVLVPSDREEDAFSPEENAILIGVLQGLFETPFKARITDNGQRGEPYTPMALQVKDTEELESALLILNRSEKRSSGRHSETDLAKLITITQSSSSDYLIPVSPGWQRILHRARTIEGGSDADRGIRQRNFREAIGRAFIEDLPLEYPLQHLNQAATLQSALERVEEAIRVYTNWRGAEHPFVVQYKMLREILQEMGDLQDF